MKKIWLLLLLSQPALAQELSIRPSMQWFSIVSGQQLSDSRINSENKLGLAEKAAAFDLRPNLKVDSTKFQLIARPQLRAEIAKRHSNQKDEKEHPKASSKWIEAYGNYSASDKVLVSYGLQNYQWGAAESINASNRIYHETAENRDLLYTVQARHIMRLNITWLKNLSSVVMAETEEPQKNTPTFRAEEAFQTKALMKHEINWNSGADYAGFVYGAGETGAPWLGEYVNLNLFAGLSAYADASHQKTSEAWYPVEERSDKVPGGTVVMLRQSKLYDSKLQTLGVFGLRYSFEDGTDLRVEYIVNTAGWSKEEQELAWKALEPTQLQLENLSMNSNRWMRPGLEYRGKQYGFASLRLPDFLSQKDLTVYLRNLTSIQDRSTSTFGSVEYGFGDASTALLSVAVSTGERDQELKGLVRQSVLAGLRQDF